MSQPFIGPLTDPQLPAQPTFQAFCINWDAFDVPRLWDIVRLEDDELGWEQVTGFRHLSDLLIDHYRRLRTQHAALAQAWQSPAAEVVLARVSAYANAILSDGQCAAATANALHTIMTTYAEARAKVTPLISEWNNVTSDWKPEWWDHAADKLNAEAREIMVKTDSIVGDHRKRITIPDSHSTNNIDLSRSIVAEAPTNSTATGLTGRVPPVPGFSPLTSTSFAALAGMPASVSAVPGQPVSMLPVPPGGLYVPYGGAYILPGPGVGRAGYIVPMPHPAYGPGGFPSGGTQRNPGSYPLGFRSNAGAASPAGPAMLPMAFGSPATPAGISGSIIKRGTPNTLWYVEKGGPAVIEGIDADEIIPDQPSEQQEQDFKEWFAELAYPWRSEKHEGRQPHIILRKLEA